MTRVAKYVSGNPLMEKKKKNNNCILHLAITIIMILIVMVVVRNTNGCLGSKNNFTLKQNFCSGKRENFLSGSHNPTITTSPIYTKMKEKRLYNAITSLTNVNKSRQRNGQLPREWNDWWASYKIDNPLSGDLKEKLITENKLNPY